MITNTWTTSSACSGADCLEAQYRTSSFSYGHGDCVEVALPEGRVLVRDTKDRARPPVKFTPAAWAAFTAGVRGREFEVGSVRV
jgi:hypothetical protein